MTRTYPLGVARAVAVRTLTELGTQRPGWRPNPDYWMELLAEALRQMVDATAPDRVIDVAPLPEHDAASAAEVAEDVDTSCTQTRPDNGIYRCVRDSGHDGYHIDVTGSQWASGHLAQHTGSLLAGHHGVHIDTQGREFGDAGQTRAHIMSSSPGYYVPSRCPSCSSGTATRLRPGELPCTNPWHAAQQAAGHLAQHTGGQPGCTYPGCTIHQPAPTREVSAAVLAAHPLDGGQ